MRATRYAHPVAPHGLRLQPPRVVGPCSVTLAVQHVQRRRHTKAIVMLYRGVEYSVVQGIEHHLWKWVATVSGTEISGEGITRDEAIEKAKKAIHRAIQEQRFKQNLDGED